MSAKRIVCEFQNCHRSYSSIFNLKRHVESAHLGLKKYKCLICSRFISSKQNLIDHQNMHSGAKPYCCNILDCRQEFKHLSQFNLHKKFHSEIRNRMINSSRIILNSLQLLTKRISEETQQKYVNNEPTSLTQLILPEINQKSFDFKRPCGEKNNFY